MRRATSAFASTFIFVELTYAHAHAHTHHHHHHQAIWCVPDVDQTGKFVYVLFMYLAYQSTVCAYHVPYSAMTARTPSTNPTRHLQRAHTLNCRTPMRAAFILYVSTPEYRSIFRHTRLSVLTRDTCIVCHAAPCFDVACPVVAIGATGTLVQHPV